MNHFELELIGSTTDHRSMHRAIFGFDGSLVDLTNAFFSNNAMIMPEVSMAMGSASYIGERSVFASAVITIKQVDLSDYNWS